MYRIAILASLIVSVSQVSAVEFPQEEVSIHFPKNTQQADVPGTAEESAIRKAKKTVTLDDLRIFLDIQCRYSENPLPTEVGRKKDPNCNDTTLSIQVRQIDKENGAFTLPSVITTPLHKNNPNEMKQEKLYRTDIYYVYRLRVEFPNDPVASDLEFSGWEPTSNPYFDGKFGIDSLLEKIKSLKDLYIEVSKSFTVNFKEAFAADPELEQRLKNSNVELRYESFHRDSQNPTGVISETPSVKHFYPREYLGISNNKVLTIPRIINVLKHKFPEPKDFYDAQEDEIRIWITSKPPVTLEKKKKSKTVEPVSERIEGHFVKQGPYEPDFYKPGESSSRFTSLAPLYLLFPTP
ncbi:MAG: hypothetical protein JWQ35_2710 [Bacteriovoracaceae bacterium]|nr:hypothetical protein [Bacteriovoracaceae bacterium]